MRNAYDVRRLRLRTLFKLHTIALLSLMGLYGVLAFLDPGLLSYDLRQKFRALADDTIVVTATVLDAPVQPIVTATADCNETNGTLRVLIDWADDSNSFTYDIERDSTPLVSGLSASAYSDTSVVTGATYEYVVTANGPMGPGTAVSDPVSVTLPTECEVTAAAPAVTVVSFSGRNVDDYDGTPRVKNRRPLFTGTTSMVGADILVTIGQHFLAEFSANSNGYWEWRPPSGVNSGRQTFTVIATDPDDAARTATAILHFDILKDDDVASPSKAAPGGGVPISPIDFDSGVVTSQRSLFTLSLLGNEQPVLQGSEFQIFLQIRGLLERYTHITIPIRYSLIDQDYEILFSETRDTFITEGAAITESFTLPDYVAAGRYFMQAELLFDDMSVSRKTPLLVEELPLISMWSGQSISYADVVAHLGWIMLLLILIFFIWLYLFLREFALYLQGDGHVTEYDLKRAGFIRK